MSIMLGNRPQVEYPLQFFIDCECRMNHHDDLYVIQQNNAGVDCFMKSFDNEGALNHFRQALSTKLAAEQRTLIDEPMYMIVDPNENGSLETIQRCVTPEPYDDERIDAFMENSISQCQMEPVATSYCRDNVSILEAPSFQDETEIQYLQSNVQQNSSNTSNYVPYLYLNTFMLSDPGIETNHSLCEVHVPTGKRKRSESSQTNTVPIQSIMMSTVIVLNLGILYHSMNRSAAKSAAFYEVAISLLQSQPTTTERNSLTLYLVVLNNYGVWCYENHEIDTMIHCFEEINHLLVLLEADDRRNDSHGNITSSFDVSVKDGIRRNLTEYLI
jgi:hypothetical protein